MRVLLIGWDAADWKVIQPLLQAGQMPNLARFMSEGVYGNLSTIYPVLSPMLWTSIATGKRAYKHGIHGFSEPLPDGSAVRPITLLSRKTKAVWNILNQAGHRSVVVGWWPSHPAEPINGVMVSNHFSPPPANPDKLPPLPLGTVHPAALAQALAQLRVSPMELSGEFMRLFVPDYEKIDQSSDKRLHMLGRVIAETMSIHSVATELLGTQPWDFAAIYYSGIDHFGHGFMTYHPPRLPWVEEEEFALYQHVIDNAYRYHDAMLGTLLGCADESTTVILMSDHGFHPDHLRPGYIPAEPAGPAVEHRHFGIVCLKGPSLRVNERLYGASVLDICPTILTLFGLAPGRDMDGKILVTAFKQAPAIEPIASWDEVPGETGAHPADARMDPVASAEAFKQLVDLGYVAPPGPNMWEAVEESARELKYNLARAYRDGNCCKPAAELAEELWTRWPKEHRFGILLVDCLGALGPAQRRTAIEELGRRIERYQAEANEQLAKLEAERRSQEEEAKATEPAAAADAAANDAKRQRAQFEERQLRELAYGAPLLLEWFRVSQALLEKNHAEARHWLEQLSQAPVQSVALSQRMASAMARLGSLDAAAELLEKALEEDPEDALVHSQLAAVHFEAGRFDKTVASATESLSLLYFQPGTHALLGQALMETNRFAEAEQALLVAVTQSPRNLVGHELLGRLYRQHLNRPEDAFAHEGRALSLRNEWLARQRAAKESAQPKVNASEPLAAPPRPGSSRSTLPRPNAPTKFGPDVDPNQIITVVSGLPRSGTSMMMQLLQAGGRNVLTDSSREADEDNPLGYFEFEKVPALSKDHSWLPQARGKVVKIVAQLLPMLPGTEHYRVILMERDLSEVIASQKVMLTRQGRAGAALGETDLAAAYSEQLRRVRQQLARRPEFQTLVVNYSELLADPSAGVESLVDFIGEPFDRQAAANCIRPELRRQKIG